MTQAEDVSVTVSSTLPALRSATRVTAMVATVAASAVAALGGTLIRVAIPAIGRDFNSGVSALQWTARGYFLTTAAQLLLGGALADRYGANEFSCSGCW